MGKIQSTMPRSSFKIQITMPRIFLKQALISFQASRSDRTAIGLLAVQTADFYFSMLFDLFLGLFADVFFRPGQVFSCLLHPGSAPSIRRPAGLSRRGLGMRLFHLVFTAPEGGFLSRWVFASQA